MPAKKSVNNDKKVMDISKPGKGKVVATSRPVVAPIASDTETATAPEISSPSAARKVIQPITPVDELVGEGDKDPKKAPKSTSIKIITNTPEDNEEPVEVKPAEEDKPEPETNEEPVKDEPTEESGEPKEETAEEETPPAPPVAEVPEPEAPEESPKEEPAEPEKLAETPPETPAEPAPEEKPAVEPPAPADDVKPAETKEETPAEASPPVVAPGSDSASVDAIANQAETKKEAAKKAEEQAKKDAELQNLIDSKQYFVPIGHHVGPATKKGRGLIVFLVLLIAVIAAAYLAVDAELIDVGLKLPYDLI